MNRKLVTFTIALTAQLFLFGQESQKELGTYRQGFDNLRFDIYEVERIPDTVWLEVSNPATIMMNLSFEFDIEKKDTDYCVYGHVSRLNWASTHTETQLNTYYEFDFLPTSGWIRCDSEDAVSSHTDAMELKMVLDSLLNTMSNRLIGRPCKVCSPMYKRCKVGSVPMKWKKKKHGFTFLWKFCVLPKVVNNN